MLQYSCLDKKLVFLKKPCKRSTISNIAYCIYDQIHAKVDICYSEISNGRSSILCQTADDKNLNITFNKVDV